ncbi:hypothetical protein EEB14_36465 [Rhodococcus sp. WS4]|nr:hypothetical protein EEB14_36465 [Rhodococcus sp. WS4]
MPTREFAKFTSPYDLARIPTITLPVAFDDRGAPIAVQLCATVFLEATISTPAMDIQTVTD